MQQAIANPPASRSSPSPSVTSARRTLKRVTCPHCWQRFKPEQLLWISRHAELMGDQVLGAEAPARFLPTRFTLDGQAVDARGMTCHWLACPNCHLSIVRDLLDMDSLFLSIIGVPSSGKSYFLATMTWELRQLMPRFGVTFTDADPVSNRVLNEYEETLFLRGESEELAVIRKTELQGELYDQIQLGAQVISLPRPFLFTLRQSGGGAGNRVLCLYDNAGEHFQPGMDSVSSPVTQHLAKSRVLMYIFDPTQDVRFRDRCRAFSEDPQLRGSQKLQNQATILTEAALRVRRYAGLSSGEKLDRPLLFIVAKSDVWGPLLPDVDITSEPTVTNGDGLCAVDVRRVEATSAKIRAMILSIAPEFVRLAEEFCEHVIFIPVSALGHSPEVDGETKALGIRPQNVKPRWVTVPILFTLAKWAKGLIPAASSREKK